MKRNQIFLVTTRKIGIVLSVKDNFNFNKIKNSHRAILNRGCEHLLTPELNLDKTISETSEKGTTDAVSEFLNTLYNGITYVNSLHDDIALELKRYNVGEVGDFKLFSLSYNQGQIFMHFKKDEVDNCG